MKKKTAPAPMSLNDQRKLKYHADPNYRAKALAQSRESYRRNSNFEAKHDCRVNLPNLKTIGHKRQVLLSSRNAKTGLVLCFTNKELAEALSIAVSTLHKWQVSGRIPEPKFNIIFPDGHKSPVTQNNKVYLLEEVKAILEIVGEHQAHFNHYRESHADTMRKLNLKLNEIRKGQK